MEEVKSGKAKTLTFLVLGVIVVFIGWFILGKFIPSVSFENMFGGANKDKFKLEVQLVYKNALETFQKEFSPVSKIYSDCNDNYEHLTFNTLSGEAIHYYVEIDSSSKVQKLIVSSLDLKVECEDTNGISIIDLGKEKCEIVKVKDIVDQVDYTKICK